MNHWIVFLLSLFALSACSSDHVKKEVIVKPSHIHYVRNLEIENALPVTVLRGKRPIVVSAPHALKVSRKNMEDFSDKGTGELAVILHKLCDVTVVYLSSPQSWNPSCSDDNLYKEALKQVIQEENPKLVIDLHRAHEYRPFDIDFGTLHGVSCHPKILTKLKTALEREGIRSFSHNFFSAAKSPTVTKFTHHYGINAIQVEINSTWLGYDGSCHDAHRFAQLLEGLSQFLLTYPLKP